jgi:hypothetical protein
VRERGHLQARLGAHLPEGHAATAAFAEEEKVADTEEGSREAAACLGHAVVEIGVAGDDEIGAGVAVDVPHRGAGRPAVCRDARFLRAFGEVPHAVVPQE